MMRLNKKAFTLTELLIALGVIGILTAILLPVIMNMLPDQNVLMAKRAYYATQTVISDMMNNDSCYPDSTGAADGDKRVGFDDGFPYPNCNGWSSVGDGEEKDPCEKFVTLFKQELDIKDGDSNKFRTRDGIDWDIDIGSSCVWKDSKNDAEQYITIYVDVNGDSKPNRIQSSSDTAPEGLFVDGHSLSARNEGPFDVFSMRVYANGKIGIDEDIETKTEDGKTVDPSWARNAIDVSKDVLGQ